MKRTVGSDILNFIRVIDPKSWPAFIMFAVVLIAAGWLNYIAMEPIIGAFGAVTIALFFGFGVLSWHIVESRTDDSAYQESVAGIVKWVNVVLDGSLIVLNLFRAELRNGAIAGMTWADAIAFVLVGISAASHVVGYLLWTKNDQRRILKKEGERDMYEVDRKRQRSDNAIKSTRARAEALKFIIDEEKSIREQYEGVVPQWQVEELIKQMKVNALKDFEGLQVAPQDVDKTKSIPAQRPAYAANTNSPQAPTQPPSLPKNTGGQAPKTQNPNNSPQFRPYTLDEFLREIGMSKADLLATMRSQGLVGETETREELKRMGRWPSDLSNNNFKKLFAELNGQGHPNGAGGRH